MQKTQASSFFSAQKKNKNRTLGISEKLRWFQ